MIFINRHELIKSSFLVLPKIHPFTFGDEASSEGETISVQCTISSGDLPISFSWLLNGEPLPDYLGINVGSFGKKMSILNIDSTSAEHTGNYTCLASNRAGFSTYTATLNVKGTVFVFSFVQSYLASNLLSSAKSHPSWAIQPPYSAA